MIRWATKEDVPALVPMAQGFIEEHYAETLTFNAEQTEGMLTRLIENPSGFLLVSDQGWCGGRHDWRDCLRPPVYGTGALLGDVLVCETGLSRQG